MYVSLCAALLALVTWQVATAGPLRLLDERAGLRLAGRGPRALAELCADLGNTQVALPVLALASAYALWRGGRSRLTDVLLAGAAMAAVGALVLPLKLLIDRQGPLTEASGYYPSGHTATATVAYCAAALLLAPHLGRGASSRAAAWPLPAALALSLATGIGLVLCGYHWPLDVIGSWCLCGLLLLPLVRRAVTASTRRRSA